VKRVRRDLADATATDLLSGRIEICGNEERRNRLAIEKAKRLQEERENEAKKRVVANVVKVGKPYSMGEVAKHNSKSDCWVIINGQICDLSGFMGKHPGGEGPIMRFAGKDASVEWNAIHRPDAIDKLAKETIIGYVEG
jgi:cytochrome b involved in lipid metabolism